MTPITKTASRDWLRHLLFLTNPSLWPVYPFLPVVRNGKHPEQECGLMFDAKGLHGLFGYSSTVFLVNLFALPRALPEFLALPREVFDTMDELYEAGWRID